MKNIRSIILILCLVLYAGMGYCQQFAVKTNLLYGLVALTPNLGFEAAVSKHSTLGLSGSWNPFPINSNGIGENNKKIKHWAIEPEYRYYFCKPFYKHFVGVTGFYSEYNIGGVKIPWLFRETGNNFRHQGYMGGFSLNYGFHLILDKRWSMVFDVGLGYAYMEYDNYECPECGRKVSHVQRHYFGPTKIEIALMLLIN